MVVAETTALQRRIRTAGFLFLLVLIAVSVTSSFVGVLRGLEAKEARDPPIAALNSRKTDGERVRQPIEDGELVFP